MKTLTYITIFTLKEFGVSGEAVRAGGHEGRSP